MKTIEDVLNSFFTIVNVATVTDILGGSIYRIEKDLNSTDQDLVLSPLPINGAQRTSLQDGTIMINCFSENHIKTGRPDEIYLNSITDVVLDVLEDFADLSTYFNFEVISQNIYPDTTNESLSFSNIRVNYLIET